MNERFKVAAELLSGEQAGLRIAGVSAMAGLADDWETQRQMCVDTLKLHENDVQTKNKIFRALKNGSAPTRGRAVVRAELRLHRSSLRGGRLQRARARWSSTAPSSPANTRRSSALPSATPCFNCQGTSFANTRVSFQDAYFDGGAMEFVGCKFDQTTIVMSRLDARVRGIYFYRSKFTDSGVLGMDAVLHLGTIHVERCKLIESDVAVYTLDPTIRAVRFGGGEPEGLPAITSSEPQ